MKIAVLRERKAGELRVAISPETTKKLVGLGADVVIESGAGDGARWPDKMFEDAGGKIAKDAGEALDKAGMILSVRGLEDEELAKAPSGALLLGLINPYGARDRLEAYAKAGLTVLSMEFMPRISRAQAMDALSSQSNLAGYKAVLDATAEFGKAMPMMMTAAGTIAPARVFIMGVGVAGLQAIATAKRLGAVVSATDVRAATKEQVESLGGKFVMVETDDDDAETEGGYAKEMSEDYKKKQAQLIADTIAKQDIVITTALIPGKQAPVLVNDDMIASMKPGSVIVDLAVEQGGNVTASKPGEVVDVGGVKIVGHINVPSRIPTDASSLYAKNLLNLIQLMVDKESGDLAIDWDDQLFSETRVVHDGAISHPRLTENAA